MDVPFESEFWTWEVQPTVTQHLGRDCILLDNSTGTVAGVEFVDGFIEVELAVGAERGFHGVVWRMQDDENLESFYVRPHQVGNPDAIQYTPVFNAISSWQLYHGPGFWAPISFPLDDWFRVRVVFMGERAEVYVGDMDDPALEIRELKASVQPGRVGVFAGGPGLHPSGFAYEATEAAFRRPALLPAPPLEGIVPAWWVSDAFPKRRWRTTPSSDTICSRDEAGHGWSASRPVSPTSPE